MYAGEVHQLYHPVVAIGRQEVHTASLLLRRLYQAGQHGHGRGVLHTALCGHVGYAVHAAIPHDVLQVYVIAYEPLAALVGVYHTHQSLAVLSEVVEECAVLAETVGIAGIVDGRKVVARQDDEAGLYAPAQDVASLAIGVFAE